MSVWAREPLGKHAEIRARIGWRGLSSAEYRAEGPFLIAGQHIQNGRVTWDECDHVSDERYEESREIALRAGDVIISKDGTIGRVARIDDLPSRATLNGTMMLVRPKRSLDYRFLYHFLGGRSFQKLVEDKVSGSSIPHLFQRDMIGLSIDLPPECEQFRIATVLDTVDEAIAKTEAVIAKLKQVRAGLLHDLLTRGLDENGQLRDPIAHPEQFKDSPLGRIPREWEIKTLATLCVHIGSGVTPRGGEDAYTSGGVMFIRSQNVTFDGLLLDDVAFIPEEIHLGMIRSEVFAHDVLFNITGASIGRCCALPEGLGRANVNQHVCALRVTNTTSPDAKYLASLLASHIGQRQMETLNTMGNRQGLNYQQLGSFVIPWPKPKEREAIAAAISAVEKQLRAETAQGEKLKLLKSGLMNDLLSGRVRVLENIVDDVRHT